MAGADRALWSRIDLLEAVRRRTPLEALHPGVRGVVTAVREDDVVMELQGPDGHTWGRGYVRITAIRTPPPHRFGPGERVQTPYGKGVVRALRATEGHVDYVVDLIENTLSAPAPTTIAPAAVAAPATPALARVDSMGNVGTPGAAEVPPSAAPAVPCAVGYLSAADVRPRTSRTIDECISDAAGERNLGNEAYRAKDLARALLHYQAAQGILGGYEGPPLSAANKRVYLDSFIKAYGNAAQCALRQEPADLAGVVSMMSEALRLDPADMTGNTAKNLLRRGEAYLRLQDWNHAIDDLSHRLLASIADAQRMLKTARDAKAKEAQRSKKMWSNAFAKAAEEPEEGAGAGAGTPPKASGADGKSVRFTTPGTGGAGGGAAGAASAVPVDDSDTPDKAGAQARKLFAGATPFPGSKKRPAPSEAAAASAGDGDPAPETVEGDAPGTLTAEKEVEGEHGSGEGSVWPWLLGGAAVALGAGALWYLASRGGSKAALRR